MIIASSSEGTVRNGVGDTIKMELMSILRGDYLAPHVSIWWYKLDDINEVGNASMWIKANPNLGITVSYETYQSEVERAENVPSARNDILAKRFGIPMEGYTYFFTYYETLPPAKYGCGCNCNRNANYLAEFGANIAIPDGETVGPISLAFALDGGTIEASSMSATPTVTQAFFNVSRTKNIPVLNGCCQTLTVRNTSSIPILVSDPSIVISRPDLAITR